MMEGMSTYRRGRTYWVKVTDHKGIPLRMSSRSRKRDVALSMERTLANLIDSAGGNRQVSDETANWVNTQLDDSRRKQLLDRGLIDTRRLAAAEKLEKHLETWRDDLRCGNTERHAEKHYARARMIIKAIDAQLFADLSSDRIKIAIHKLGLSQTTQNHYLTAVKGFVRWMVGTGKAPRYPDGFMLLKRQKVSKWVVNRRPLTDVEIAKLLRTPWRKRICYLMALRTGIREDELRKLTHRNFDLEHRVVKVMGKGKREDTLSIPPELAKYLGRWLRHVKHGRLFRVPYKAAKMIHKDTGSTDIDFHCLRHTYCTQLARNGVHPSVAQRMMRHVRIETTMRFYTHLQFADDVSAAEGLEKCALNRAQKTTDSSPNPRQHKATIRMARSA